VFETLLVVPGGDGGDVAERTDAGWGRPSEPAPRWRTLLDRALLGRGSPGELDYDGRFDRPRSPYQDDHDYPPPPSANGNRMYDVDAPPRSPAVPRGGMPMRPDVQPRRPVDPDRGGYPPVEPDRGGYGPVEPARGGYPQLEWQPQRSSDPTEQMVQVLRQEIPSPRVLAFANPKGGVHKTTATVLSAATIGSVRGRGVIAWDDNELRGTLGLRAGSARHARTIRHLIANLAEVENLNGYDLHDTLDDYLRHASDGSYDVLAGEENPRFAQRLDPYTVRRVLELLRRTHDVICVDTGNNVESPNWQTVLQAADQLVVTSVPREDAAFTADWMLDLLDEAGMDELVANAVTLLSCPTPNATPLIDDLASHFRSRTRAVVVVPYDPALESGSNIEYGMLAATTKRAWLRAAAVMMDPYAR
jgi:MinD-like ATPase involved in chromosome partitioning or flagellar assembly